jgi:hypothetical protein
MPRDGYTKGYGRAMKQSKRTARMVKAIMVARSGVPVAEAASIAGVSKQKLERALRIDSKHLEEGEQVTEQSGGINSSEVTHLGEEGVAYGSAQAERLVARRLAELAQSGREGSRQTVLRELANGGAIRTHMPHDYVPTDQRTPQPAPQLTERFGELVHQQGQGRGRFIELSEDGVYGLAERIRRTAKERRISEGHAFAELWAYEGGEDNRYSPQAWSAVAGRLGVRLA